MKEMDKIIRQMQDFFTQKVGNDVDDSDWVTKWRKLRDAAKTIKNYCNHHICEECPFNEGYENQCKIHGYGKPFTWEID